ncbi:hypothetical protein Q4485_02240 [Granulosicoccaceae sp. 1_MG-2023]|nr:hypothetical protein [Granulosicoccaceae sp. 1_MG-2023]
MQPQIHRAVADPPRLWKNTASATGPESDAIAVKAFFFNIFCVALLMVGPAAAAGACEIPPQRRVVDLIMNADFSGAENALAALPGERRLFQAMIHLGETHHARGRRYERLLGLAAAELDALIGATHDPRPQTQLYLGMAEAFRSRIHMENKQWLKAYRLGHRARERLQALLQGPQAPQDALLVLGLFDYYTASLPAALRWLTHLVDMAGDRARGLRHLQAAAKHATIAAPEAARVLFDEITDTAPEVCRWLGTNREMRRRYPDNPALSLALQRNLRKCGQPRAALQENALARQQFRTNRHFRQAFYAEQARSLRDLGQASAIRAMAKHFNEDWLGQRIAEAEAAADPAKGAYRPPARVPEGPPLEINRGCPATQLTSDKAIKAQATDKSRPITQNPTEPATRDDAQH